jgi:predicted nucleic acid-binding protein
MHAECVLDASVAGAIFFNEIGSPDARALARSGIVFLAPDLLAVEIASIASKKVRRGEIPRDHGELAVRRVGALVSEMAAPGPFTVRAFELASAHGFSAYDALYLALAEARGTHVVTADAKLSRRAEEAGLAALVKLVA